MEEEIKNCKVCKHFNPWAISMFMLEAVPICKKEVWHYDPYENIEVKLQMAKECQEFKKR